jgi:hypothetical protein
MFARIVRSQIPAEHFDRILAATKERNLPMVTQFPGFKSGYWAADRHAGQVATFVLMDSEEGIRAAEAGTEQMRPLVEQFGARFDLVENLQILITEAALPGPPVGERLCAVRAAHPQPGLRTLPVADH